MYADFEVYSIQSFFKLLVLGFTKWLRMNLLLPSSSHVKWFFNSTWYVIKPYPFKSMWSYNIWPLKNKCPTYTNAQENSLPEYQSCLTTLSGWPDVSWVQVLGWVQETLRCGMAELVSPKATGTKEAVVVAAVVAAQWLSCVQLFCNPRHCSPPGSSVHGISQARILAAAKSLRSCPTLCNPTDGSPPRVGYNFLLQGIFSTQGSGFLLHWQVDVFTTEPPEKPGREETRCNQRERKQRNATPVREAGQKLWVGSTGWMKQLAKLKKSQWGQITLSELEPNLFGRNHLCYPKLYNPPVTWTLGLPPKLCPEFLRFLRCV